MLTRALQIAAIIGLLLFGALCVGALIVALQLREESIEISNRVDASLDTMTAHTVAMEDAAKRQIDALETLKLTHDARLTLDNVNKAAIDERMYFEREVPAAMGRVNAALDGVREDEAGLRETESAATMVLDQTTTQLHLLTPIETRAVSTLSDMDALIANPHWAQTLTNLDATTAASASTAQHLDGTAGDVQTAVHGYLHPGWKTRAVNWASQAAHTLGGWF